ncbi:MAG: hypothetical protein B7Z62_08835 [Deltaproteobacteria bacterium 37-65-8]|nr:MAG: hypothetical protein B7Z62_08835 [Deltaproteobacteria bacterium 37-65-8]
MNLYCCACQSDIDARLTDGAEIYAHRPDLHSLPFWKCDACGNFVGCHHKTADRTRPLGCIPTAEIKNARKEIHKLLDPLWMTGIVSRRQIYAELTKVIGREYHTADIRSLDEARKVYRYLRKMTA